MDEIAEAQGLLEQFIGHLKKAGNGTDAQAATKCLILARAGPERSAISRSCASMKWRAGASPSRPPSMELGTLRLDVTVPSS